MLVKKCSVDLINKSAILFIRIYIYLLFVVVCLWNIFFLIREKKTTSSSFLLIVMRATGEQVNNNKSYLSCAIQTTTFLCVCVYGLHFLSLSVCSLYFYFSLYVCCHLFLLIIDHKHVLFCIIREKNIYIYTHTYGNHFVSLIVFLKKDLNLRRNVDEFIGI
jgi:hypothetical protein